MLLRGTVMLFLCLILLCYYSDFLSLILPSTSICRACFPSFLVYIFAWNMYVNLSACWKSEWVVLQLVYFVSFVFILYFVKFSQIKVGCYTSVKNIHHRLVQCINFCLNFVFDIFAFVSTFVSDALDIACKHSNLCSVYDVSVVIDKYASMLFLSHQLS